MHKFSKRAGLSGEQRAQFRWHGVSLESSASDAGELDTMLELVSALSPRYRAMIKTIYCDSDAGHCRVQLCRGNQGVVAKILLACAAVLYAHFGPVRSLTIEIDRSVGLLRGSPQARH